MNSVQLESCTPAMFPDHLKAVKSLMTSEINSNISLDIPKHPLNDDLRIEIKKYACISTVGASVAIHAFSKYSSRVGV